MYRKDSEVFRSTTGADGSDSGIQLTGTIQSIDLPTNTVRVRCPGRLTRQMTINWYFGGVDEWARSDRPCNPLGSNSCAGTLNTDVSIYVNGASTPYYNFSAVAESNDAVSSFFTTRSTLTGTDPTRNSVVATSFPFATCVWQSLRG